MLDLDGMVQPNLHSIPSVSVVLSPAALLVTKAKQRYVIFGVPGEPMYKLTCPIQRTEETIGSYKILLHKSEEELPLSLVR